MVSSSQELISRIYNRSDEDKLYLLLHYELNIINYFQIVNDLKTRYEAYLPETQVDGLCLKKEVSAKLKHFDKLIGEMKNGTMAVVNLHFLIFFEHCWSKIFFQRWKYLNLNKCLQTVSLPRAFCVFTNCLTGYQKEWKDWQVASSFT